MVNNNRVDILGTVTLFKKYKECGKFTLSVKSTELIDGERQERTDNIKCICFEGLRGLRELEEIEKLSQSCVPNEIRVQGSMQNNKKKITNEKTGEVIISESIVVVVNTINKVTPTGIPENTT